MTTYKIQKSCTRPVIARRWMTHYDQCLTALISCHAGDPMVLVLRWEPICDPREMQRIADVPMLSKGDTDMVRQLLEQAAD